MVNDTFTLKTHCSDCGELLEDNWKFCPHCKEKQKRAKCVHCKKEINAFWNFCPFCKKSLKVKSYIGTGQKGDDWIKQILLTR